MQVVKGVFGAHDIESCDDVFHPAHFCTCLGAFPENAFEEATCFFQLLMPQVMISEWQAFCAFDFSSTAEIAEMKEVQFTLEYKMDADQESTLGVDAKDKVEETMAEILGVDAQKVSVSVHPGEDSIKVSILTKQHADMEARLEHEWFPVDLAMKLNTINPQSMFIDELQVRKDSVKIADPTTTTTAPIEEEDDLEEKAKSLFQNKAVIAIIAGSVVLVCIAAMSCLRKKSLDKDAGVQIVVQN
jgi:hypothetical protein